MFEQYLVDKNIIGTTAVPAQDGSELMMYSTFEGKVFLKSRDHFRTVDEKWLTTIGTMTANANLIRLKDGRLMMPVKLPSPNKRIAQLGGADFAVMFSSDDGHSFGYSVRVNQENGCCYIMNQRIMRTHSGRILLPVGWVPNELLDEQLETVGWAGCFISDDEGQTWRTSQWIKGETVDQLCEPIIVQGEDDRLFMYMRTGVGHLYYSVSDDDGETWTQEVPSMLRSPCAPFCIQYDEYEKRFLSVWDNSFPGTVHQYPRTPICLAQSKDGVNWKMICELGANPCHGYGYPMIRAYEDEILITYYESAGKNFNPREHKLQMKILSRDEAR